MIDTTAAHRYRSVTKLMISNWELWGCALKIIQDHGESTNDHVAERVATLAAQNDREGVKVWLAIAERIDRIRDLSVRH